MKTTFLKQAKRVTLSLSLLTLVNCGAGGVIDPAVIDTITSQTNQNMGEFGDAPDQISTGYASGIMGSFPTYLKNNGAHHLNHSIVALGMPNQQKIWPATTEVDANDPADEDSIPNLDEPNDTANQDEKDDGLLTLAFGSDEEASIEFAATAATTATQSTYYVNALFDWNKDGEWSGDDVNEAPEWAVQNMPVTLKAGESKVFRSPLFSTGVDAHPVWMRLTVSDTPVSADPDTGWDGTGEFALGETEDYFLDGTQILALDKDGVAIPGVPFNFRGPNPVGGPGGGAGGGGGGGGAGGGGECSFQYDMRAKVCVGKSMNRLLTIGGFAPDSLIATSSDPSVASVSLNEANVSITGNSEGTTTIDILATQGGCKYYLSITIVVEKCPKQKKVKIECCTQEEIRRDPSQCQNCHVVGRQHNATNTYGGGGEVPETDMEGKKTNISKSYVLVRGGGLVDIITVYYDCDPCPEPLPEPIDDEADGEDDQKDGEDFFESFFDIFSQTEFGGANQIIDNFNEYEALTQYYDEQYDEALYECATNYFNELFGENK